MMGFTIADWFGIGGPEIEMGVCGNFAINCWIIERLHPNAYMYWKSLPVIYGVVIPCFD